MINLGGLAIATVLTLVFLPALYVAVNGIREKVAPAAESGMAAEPDMAAVLSPAMPAAGAASTPLSPMQL
jgi:hypothetical protein